MCSTCRCVMWSRRLCTCGPCSETHMQPRLATPHFAGEQDRARGGAGQPGVPGGAEPQRQPPHMYRGLVAASPPAHVAPGGQPAEQHRGHRAPEALPRAGRAGPQPQPPRGCRRDQRAGGAAAAAHADAAVQPTVKRLGPAQQGARHPATLPAHRHQPLPYPHRPRPPAHLPAGAAVLHGVVGGAGRLQPGGGGGLGGGGHGAAGGCVVPGVQDAH
mmetsp:Transcript_4493/g.11595  ORF Transcript_4493/g.11595 Transcript_4493/m.11595 type:complete len:216 (-) Transcript_4493:1146-1793(-)